MKKNNKSLIKLLLVGILTIFVSFPCMAFEIIFEEDMETITVESIVNTFIKDVFREKEKENNNQFIQLSNSKVSSTILKEKVCLLIEYIQNRKFKSLEDVDNFYQTNFPEFFNEEFFLETSIIDEYSLLNLDKEKLTLSKEENNFLYLREIYKEIINTLIELSITDLGDNYLEKYQEKTKNIFIFIDKIIY